MKLEHLSPYLPYSVNAEITKRTYPSWVGIKKLTLENYFTYKSKKNTIKPILHPLSDLTKEIEHNGEKFVPIEKLLKIKFAGWYNDKIGTRYSKTTFESTPNYAKCCFVNHATHSIEIWLRGFDNECYWIVQKLIEWHFDVFGLIEKGEAIDINNILKHDSNRI